METTKIFSQIWNYTNKRISMKEFLKNWVEEQLKTFKTNLYLKSIEKANYGKYASKILLLKLE
jgi:hypothetical protein